MIPHARSMCARCRAICLRSDDDMIVFWQPGQPLHVDPVVAARIREEAVRVHAALGHPADWP